MNDKPCKAMRLKPLQLPFVSEADNPIAVIVDASALASSKLGIESLVPACYLFAEIPCDDPGFRVVGDCRGKRFIVSVLS